jgi:hypothetical protein
LDIASVLLMVLAAAAFAAGMLALTDKEDVVALYWLLVGALALRSSTELLRPKQSAR